MNAASKSQADTPLINSDANFPPPVAITVCDFLPMDKQRTGPTCPTVSPTFQMGVVMVFQEDRPKGL